MLCRSQRLADSFKTFSWPWSPPQVSDSLHTPNPKSTPPSKRKRANTTAHDPSSSLTTSTSEALTTALRQAHRSLNPKLCVARTWSGSQCRLHPLQGLELCKQHQKRQPYGLYSHTISEDALLKLCQRAAAHPDHLTTLHWYSRLIMWLEAVKCNDSYTGIYDLAGDEYKDTLIHVNTYFRKNTVQRKEWNIEEFKGPQGIEDRGSVLEEHTGGSVRWKPFTFY